MHLFRKPKKKPVKHESDAGINCCWLFNAKSSLYISIKYKLTAIPIVAETLKTFL